MGTDGYGEQGKRHTLPAGERCFLKCPFLRKNTGASRGVLRQIQQMQKGGETADGADPGDTAGKVDPVFFAEGSVPHVGR